MSTQVKINTTPAALTERQLAKRWGISIKTLQDWRRKGTGVGYLKLGNKAIRYKLETIEAYEAEHSGNVGGVQ